jgi:hypothetical protein
MATFLKRLEYPDRMGSVIAEVLQGHGNILGVEDCESDALRLSLWLGAFLTYKKDGKNFSLEIFLTFCQLS